MNVLSPPVFGGFRVFIVPGAARPCTGARRRVCQQSATAGEGRDGHGSALTPPKFIIEKPLIERGQAMRAGDTIYVRAAEYAALQQRLRP